MPIVALQRRLREIGRIRIGHQVPTSNGKTRPEKLTDFRLTSRDRTVIEAAAILWGGEARPWSSPDGMQHEVFTKAHELAVIIPPGEMAFSQFYETWSAGGCQKRCDGQWDIQRDQACDCDPDARGCAIHSRLSVMLPELPGLGVWRLDTSGYYAAVELSGAVDVCVLASEKGTMLPARLRLEQRGVKRPKANGDGVETRRFVVPVLDLNIRLDQLAAGGQSLAAIGAAPGPGFTPVPVGELPEAPGSSVAAQIGAVTTPQPRPARANAAEPLRPTGLAPRTASQAATAEATPTAAPPTSGPTCALCGGTLLGFDVAFDAGRKVHKGECPPSPETVGSPDTEVLSGGVEQSAPEEATDPAPTSVAPGNLDPERPFTDDDEPYESPMFTAKDIGIAATAAFRAAYDATPRGHKTKTVDRLRYALTFALTGGPIHCDQLTVEQLAALHSHLRFIEKGQIGYEPADDGVTFILNDRRLYVPYEKFEQETAA